MKERSFLLQLAMLIAYILLGLILIMFLTGGVLMLTGADITSLEQGTEAFSSNLTIAKLLQLGSSILLFALPAVLFALDKNNNISLKLSKAVNPFSVVLALMVMVFSFPLVGLLTEFNNFSFPESLKGLETFFRNMEMDTTETMRDLLIMNNPLDLVFNLFVVAVAPAFAEELLFRAGFQQLFKKVLNPHLAIILAAFIFSAVHFQFYGLFPRWALGMILGYLFYWSGNLWYPIIAHLFNNGLLVVLIYFGAIDMSSVESMDSAQEFTTISLIIGILLMVGFLYLYQKSFEEIPKKEIES